MDEIEQFLAAAVRLEREAAARYDELADAISGLGNPEVVAFFRQQALYSRRHLEQAKARSGFHGPWEEVVPSGSGDDRQASFDFAQGESPEAAAIWAADGHLSLEEAMKVALDAEESGRVYYATVASTSPDPEVREMASRFEEEESGHVRALKDLIARYRAA